MQVTTDSEKKPAYRHIKTQTQTLGRRATMSSDASVLRTSTYGSALLLPVIKEFK